MAVEESRLLQISISTMLHKNVKNLEFSTLLSNVVSIADEVDAQLKQQMHRLMVVRRLPFRSNASTAMSFRSVFRFSAEATCLE
jgi:hypothetical protein